jgi:hypothetical protein
MEYSLRQVTGLSLRNELMLYEIFGVPDRMFKAISTISLPGQAGYPAMCRIKVVKGY